MSSQTDLELVNAFQSGDESAFNELVLRHQEKLYWLARRFVAGHAEADDVLQDALVKAYHGLKEFRSDASVFTWLYRITVNTSINALRRRKVRDFLRLDDLVIESATDDARPDEALEQDEQRRLVDEAVQRLPEKQKAVFILRYYDEMPYEEISRILNTSIGGLKANYFHAVKKVTDSIRRAHETR